MDGWMDGMDGGSSVGRTAADTCRKYRLQYCTRIEAVGVVVVVVSSLRNLCFMA